MEVHWNMKNKYVPIAKQSKRKQKEHHAAQRKDWGNVNPLTRKSPNLKAYNRKKSERHYEHECHSDFFISRVPKLSKSLSQLFY